MYLTTTAACNVVRMRRDRFNEAVASGFYECAPPTVPGRARIFSPDDMVPLWIYRDQTDAGVSKEAAGYVACQVGIAARENPTDGCIAFVRTNAGGNGFACRVEDLPDIETWSENDFYEGRIIEVRTFNVAWIRKVLHAATVREASIIGPDDQAEV